MNVEQIREVASLTSGTIASITGMNRYDEQDEFIAWLFDEGDVINFGENALIACRNAGSAWARRKTGYRVINIICAAMQLTNEQLGHSQRTIT